MNDKCGNTTFVKLSGGLIGITDREKTNNGIKSPILRVENVNHWFGKKQVLYNINLEVKQGNVISMVGGSGAGKSTLLRAILGTDPPTNGSIYAGVNLVKEPSREIGMVYQNYGIFDFLTARENIAFGPMVDQTAIYERNIFNFAWKRKRKEHLEQADDFLKKMGLNDCADSYPSELSGGMKQRVAIAQSLIMKPSILLMDEPFSALDEITRESLQLMLLNLYQENVNAKKNGLLPPYTILLVTHELKEALYVSDRVIGLSPHHPDGIHGATIVYDQPTPVFRPTDPKDFTRFDREMKEIIEVVFSPTDNSNYRKYITAWTDSTLECLPGDKNLSRDRI